MKVKLLKDYEGHKKGDFIDVDDRQASSLKIRGIAEKALDEAVKKSEKNASAGPGAEEKNSDAGPATAAELIEQIKAAESLRELNSLVKKDEERKTVLDAAEKKRAELKGE